MIRPLRDIEREVILAAIAETRGNVVLAAVQLKLGKTTVYRKLHEYGVVEDRRQKRIQFVPKLEKR